MCKFLGMTLLLAAVVALSGCCGRTCKSSAPAAACPAAVCDVECVEVCQEVVCPCSDESVDACVCKTTCPNKTDGEKKADCPKKTDGEKKADCPKKTDGEKKAGCADSSKESACKKD